MGLPYRWHPTGTRYVTELAAGMVMPYEHVAYRIIEVNDVPEVDWTDAERERVSDSPPGWPRQAPRNVIIRPVSITSDDVRARDHDRHMRWNGRGLEVYRDEHYPLCGECLEPLPCRSQMAERVSTAAAERMARYELAGVCPACGEVVTARQESLTWSDNVEVLFGPPVTFHMRRKCRYYAGDYEQRWVAADPQARKAVLRCSGHLTNHNDGTYECSELTECPGARARHIGYSVCRCPDCHARGPFGCHPSPSARNLAVAADEAVT